MTDLITNDQSLFIEGKSSIKTRSGGLLSIVFLIASAIIIYFLASDAASAQPVIVEYTANGDRSANNIDVPSLRIVYGFPSSNASNIEVILNTAGVETVIDLQDYPDQDWNEHFNFTKDPTLVYKYQDWPSSTSFTSVRQIVPTNPTTITPTPWYCIEQTGQTGPLRLNQYGDIECFSTDELNCHWNLFTNAECEAYIAENANQLNTLSCGQQHLELWDMTGYDSPTHWCSTTLTYLMGIYGSQPFLTWDNTLTGKQIFVAVEEYRFNPSTRQIQKTNKILSEIDDPNNYVVYLERTISDVRVFQGSYKTNDEVLYNHYTSNLADFVRKLPPEEIFHFNIIEPEELFLESEVKEYTYALTLDVIAQIASLIEVVFGVLVIINDIFDNYIMATLLYKYIYLSKHSRVYDNIKKEEAKQKLMATKLEEYKYFTFWNYFKCKFLKCLCKSQESKKLQANLEEIARLSSMEEFLVKDDTKEEQSSAIKRILTNFDLFPSKQNFYIKGDKKFGHAIGMLLSMLYLLIVPVAFYFIGTDFLYRQYPLKTVVPSDLAIDADLTHLYVAVPMMLYYPKEIEPVDYVLYNMQTSQWVNFTTAPTDCLDSEINDFNVTGSSDMTYKCFDLTYLANQSTTTTDFIFGIESCITKGLCNILNPTYGFVMKSYNTDVDAKKDEYSQLSIQNAVTNRSSGNNLFTLTLNFLNWTEDTNIAMNDLSNNDLFLYQDNTTFSFTPDTDSTLSSTDLTFQLTLSRQTTVVTRVFPKFIITFKKTMYVVFLVYLILYILNTAFSDYFYMLIFKDLFFQKSKHQDKEEHFSLKNHFFSMINCCFRHKSEDYNTVHKEMKDSLDIRTLFQKKHEKREGDEELGGLQSPKDMSPVKAKSFKIVGENSFAFLKSIDILPNNTKPFLIKGQPTFKTMVGGIFSVLCIVAFVILSYFTLLDFWYRTNPTVSQNNLNFGQSDLSFWVSPKSVAMIYYSMAEDYSPSFVLNAVAAERLYPISNDSCTDDDFQQLGMTRDPNYQYACVDIFETLGKVDTISNAQKRFFALSITSCPTWTSFSHTQYVGNGNYSMYLDRCASTSYTEYGKNIQVGFAAKFMDFDSNSASLLTNFINYNETNSDGDMMYSYVSVSENTLRDDVGVLTSDIKNYVFASSDSSSKLVRQGWNASTFGRLYVAFDEDTPYYIQKQRTYQKVADLAVQTTSIFSILTVVCQAIVNLFVDYLFIRHLSRYFIKSTNDLKKSKTFAKKTAKYGSNVQSSEQLGISVWSYFKFKLFRCRGKSTPYPDIINYASYERLFQNAMNNRIKLDLQTHKEQIDPSQIELAVGRSEFALGGSEFAVGTGRSEFAIGRSEFAIGQSEFAVGGSELAVGTGRPEFAVEKPEFAIAPSGFTAGPSEFAVTPSRYAGEPFEFAVAPSGSPKGQSEFAVAPIGFAGETSDLAEGAGKPEGIY